MRVRRSVMLADAGVKDIFATEFKRAQETAKPLAMKTGVAVVTVIYGASTGLDSATGSQLWHQDLNIPGSASPYGFGYALAAGDFNNDGYTDLAIGNPPAANGWPGTVFQRPFAKGFGYSDGSA